jgi:iron(III) transport system substrate-binding protein
MTLRSRAALLALLGSLILAACGPQAGAPTAPGGASAPSGAPSGAPPGGGAEGKPLTIEEIANLPIGPERQRQLEEGARREGQLMLYTTSTGLEPLIDLFQRKYPFIKMEIFATRSEPLTQRTQAEARAGRLGGDVLKTNVFAYEDLKDQLIRFNSPGAEYDRAPNAASADATGIAFSYSKPRVSPADVPQRVEDLLLPRWRRNIGLFAPPNNYPGRWVGMLIEQMGEPAARDYLRRLGEQQPYFYTQPEAARNGLLAGEWDINMQGITSAVVSARRGEPIGWVALDPTTLSPDILGLFKQAPHPYAAMLFLDWAVTPEGQHALSDTQGSITPEDLAKREKEGQKLPQRISVQSPADAPKLEGWAKLFDELVVRK